jgi:hypothetical protein
VTDDPEEPRARLRRLIGERLAAGLLPPYRGQRTFGGRGEGARCGCCDEPIGGGDVQYDVDHPDEADRSGAAGAVRTIPMHLHCYRLWIEESESRGAT